MNSGKVKGRTDLERVLEESEKFLEAIEEYRVAEVILICQDDQDFIINLRTPLGEKRGKEILAEARNLSFYGQIRRALRVNRLLIAGLVFSATLNITCFVFYNSYFNLVIGALTAGLLSHEIRRFRRLLQFAKESP